jgi:microcystin-dependent protein
MWSGSIASIPSGWALCNGSNGTPDLRDKFIVGAGTTYAVAATGGSADAIVVSHTHTITATTDSVGAHTHSVPTNSVTGPGNNGGGRFVNGDNGGGNVSTTSAGTHSHTVTASASTVGSSGTNANLPPYYALAYIMKL